jgi:hypothetical protein
MKKEAVYTGEFSCREDVENEFNETLAEGVNIIYADYDCPPYEGYAFVLFEEDGILYEVSGGHCSCYGLEGQWEPEAVVMKELENRLINGTFGQGRDELKAYLNIK